MRTLSVLLAFFLVLAGFFTVYIDMSRAGPYAVLAGGGASPEQGLQLRETLDYLDTGKGDLSFYTRLEQEHLADVRVVMLGARFLLVGCGALILLWMFLLVRKAKRNPELMKSLRDELGETVMRAGAFALVAVLLLALALVNFGSFWTAFHRVLFPQGNWQFPYDSALITLFPQEFFEAFTLHVLGACLALGLLALLGGLVLREKEKMFTSSRRRPRRTQGS